MFRILLATALISTIGITGALAGGRSKDERAAWWQTFHQETSQPWQSTAHQGTASATSSGAAAKPAKPAQ